MTIFTKCKNTTGALSKYGSATACATQKISSKKFSKRSAGNIFFALFAAVAMVGAVGYGFNTVIRGPISGMTDVTRRTVAENSVITASRVAIVNSTTQQTNGGDCDADGMIEPLQFRDAGANPKPVGGGWLPTGLLSDTKDPWNSEFGYCAWDAGSLTVANNVAGCGGSSAKRLTGSPFNNQYAIAIISPGKDRKFQTTCNAYVDTTPADSLPDTPLLVKADGSDDIVLGYTYAEANNLGNGLWKEKPLDATTLQTTKSIESTQGATFTDKVVLTGNTTTGGGLVLPGDPGDNSLSGACDVVNERQLRRNTSTSPPVIEICDWNGGAGLGWTPVSGTGGGGTSGPADCTGLGDQSYNDPVTGHCYYYESTNTFTAATANTACTADGAYLAVPSSSTENNLIFNTFPQDGPLIGVTDAGTDGTWHYMYGEKTGTVFWTGGVGGSTSVGQYSNWNAGEGGGSEDCAAWNWNGANNWIDVDCVSYTSNYICEKTGTLSGGGGGGGGTTGSLVSRWKLDEAAGAVADDAVGANDGTLLNAPTWQPTGGQDGGALRLERTGDKTVRIPRAASLESSAISLSAWVKPDTVTADFQSIIAKTWQDNTSPTWISYELDVDGNSGNKVDFWFGRAGGVERLTSTSSAPYNAWTHVAATYDPSAAAPQAKLYINGVLEASATHTTPIVYDTTSSGDLYLGKEQVSGTERFTGSLDDVRIYNYALSDIEINNIINTTSPPVPNLKQTNKPGKLFGWGTDGVLGALGNGAGQLDTNSPYAMLNGDNFVDVSAATGNGCAIKADGTVWCWGNSLPMTQMTGIADAVKIKVTGATSCALRKNGQLWCWGTNTSGVFGNGTTSPATSLTPVLASAGPNDYIDFTVNRSSTGATACALRYNGSVICWGEGSNGELGNGANADSLLPVTVSNISDFVQISGGLSALVSGGHICGVASTGTAYCWGNETANEFGNGGGNNGVYNVPTAVSTYTDWAKIFSAGQTTCGVRANGLGYCWGSDSSSQLGDGGAATSAPDPSPLNTTERFTEIGVGMTTTCGISTKRQLYCWGSHVSGQAGGGPGMASVLASPTLSNGRNVTAIAVTQTAEFMIVDENIDDAVVANIGPNLIAAGRDFACSIIAGNGVACWGDDTNGELGNGAIAGTQASPTGISEAGPWTQISANAYGTAGHACGIKGDGSAWCWGYGADGQLGNGTSNQTSPVVVDVATRKWSQVSVGSGFACGLEPDNDLYCWGTGIGATPTQLFAGTHSWKKISAGSTNVCGIDTDDSAWCWGTDAVGELGNGSATTTTQTNPVAISAPGPWVDISAGPISCGIKGDGTLWCWGDLTSAGITGWDNTSPQLMMDIGPWVKVKTNYRNVCAIKTDGSLWCFGEGSEYANGNNSTTDFGYPQRVSGGNFIDVTVGYDFACGMKSDNTAFCWGDNSAKQIGNGAQGAGDATRPVRVELTPQRPGWEFNTAETVMQPHPGLSPTIGTSLWVSDDGAATKGLNLAGSGRSQIRQPVANQLLMEGYGTGLIPQISLRAASAKVGSDVTNGLVARWNFDNAATTSVNSPTLDATLFGSPAYRTTAKVGTHALKTVAASSQYARANRDAAIETPAISISGWINLASAPSTFDYQIFDKTISDGTIPTTRLSYGAAVTPGKKFAAAIGYSGGSLIITGNATLSLNQWQHFTLTYDPSSPAPQMKLYANGVLDATGVGAQAILYDATTTGRVFIGRMAWAVQPEYFDGMIDDIRIYNRALDPGEVAQLYYYTSQDLVTRTMGVDSGTGNFEISRNNSLAGNWLTSLNPDLEVDDEGNVGVATTGMPAAKLDVNGAIKIGNSTTCNGSTKGTLRWTGTAIQYCDGTWKPLTSSQDPGAAGGWNTGGGRVNTCSLKSNGSAWCWGDSTYGRLGANITSPDAGSPIQVWDNTTAPASYWLDWINISGGVLVSCGLRTDGSAWCWGTDTYGMVGDNDLLGSDKIIPTQVLNNAGGAGWTDWVYLYAGDRHVCGIRTSGKAYCWGYSQDKAVGNNTSAWPDVSTPQEVHTDTASPGWSDWKYVETGEQHTCGIRAGGTAWCWGIDSSGQLGNGAGQTDKTRPGLVVNGWTDWKDISIGVVHTCGLRSNGTIWCWGNGSSGALGDGGFSNPQHTPVQVANSACGAGWSDWKDVDAGHSFSCGIRADGTLWCWGLGTSGQLGNNNSSSNQLCPVQVLNDVAGAGWSDWTSVSAEGGFTCGGRADGSIWCWGVGSNGELGNGMMSNSLVPVKVSN